MEARRLEEDSMISGEMPETARCGHSQISGEAGYLQSGEMQLSLFLGPDPA